MRERTVTVRAVHDEAVEVLSFEFVAAGGATLPLSTAGFDIEVRVAPGIAGRYSLCGELLDSRQCVVGDLSEPVFTIAVEADAGPTQGRRLPASLIEAETRGA